MSEAAARPTAALLESPPPPCCWEDPLKCTALISILPCNVLALELAVSSLRHTLTASCSFGNGVMAKSFCRTAVSRTPVMIPVAICSSTHVGHSCAGPAKLLSRI